MFAPQAACARGKRISSVDLFAYASLDRATEVAVRAEADVIKTRLRRTAEDVIEIGLALLRVQALLPEGSFEAWLRDEFEMSRRTAYNFMQVAQRFGSRRATVAQVGPKALYELAAPSTPDEIVAAVEAKVAAGELVTAAEVKRLRDEAKLAADKAQKGVVGVAAPRVYGTTPRPNHPGGNGRAPWEGCAATPCVKGRTTTS